MGVLARIERWADAERSPDRPLVWMHAPSVGEGLQARAVLEAFRRRVPGSQVAYTFFSPSAERFARTVGADLVDYLPFDTPAESRRALEALRPNVLAFSKTDVWPSLTREATHRGVRLVLLSATLPASSSRLRGPARILLGPAYRRLDRVAAISEADAARFGVLGVPPERREVMGDARFDQVWSRATHVDRDAPWFRALRQSGAPVVVAGSTWPADEARLLRALGRCLDTGVHFRIVLVPHEPTEAHLAAAEAVLHENRIPFLRWSAMLDGGSADPTCILVDRVGILGDLYAAADLAYVGGGWGTAGLHSVLEPAAFGAPVVFGPRHANAREAAEMIQHGGAVAVVDAVALEAALKRWLMDETARQAAGSAARAYVQAGLGAAGRGAEILESLLVG